MYVQEKTVYIGFGTILGVRHPLGFLECVPMDKEQGAVII